MPITVQRVANNLTFRDFFKQRHLTGTSLPIYLSQYSKFVLTIQSNLKHYALVQMSAI